MTPIQPMPIAGKHLIVLEGDEEVVDLPAYVDSMEVITEWRPTPLELERLLSGGVIRLTTLTYGEPFQPVKLEVTEPTSMKES